MKKVDNCDIKSYLYILGQIKKKIQSISVETCASLDRYTNSAANTCNDRADASPVNEPLSHWQRTAEGFDTFDALSVGATGIFNRQHGERVVDNQCAGRDFAVKRYFMDSWNLFYQVIAKIEFKPGGFKNPGQSETKDLILAKKSESGQVLLSENPGTKGGNPVPTKPRHVISLISIKM
ncbi:uncharacterized protein LOC113367374 [Ctenocephalides felis]|uniref:uncharacterized protein LOC113367374 n=1 Tax=Ctenocephalides felis TaxID=7515 RepID=UPI000E6E2CF1|nr:uncharacterized protein LOC113367374 [Ctenocephalides felis]